MSFAGAYQNDLAQFNRLSQPREHKVRAGGRIKIEVDTRGLILKSLLLIRPPESNDRYDYNDRASVCNINILIVNDSRL